MFETPATLSLMTKPDICHTVEKYLSCGEYSPQKNWTKNCTCGEKWQISGILMTSNLLHYYPKYETARKGNLEVNGPFKFHFCIETIRNYSRCLNNHIIPCLSPNKVENSLLQKCSHIASCWIVEHFYKKKIGLKMCWTQHLETYYDRTSLLHHSPSHNAQPPFMQLSQLTCHNSLNIMQHNATYGTT